MQFRLKGLIFQYGRQQVIRQAIHAAAPYSCASTRLAGRPRARRILTLHNVGANDLALEKFNDLVRWLRCHARVLARPNMISDLKLQQTPKEIRTSTMGWPASFSWPIPCCVN
jgi:hypothetical protein